ncbi:MAG: POT family MFS transporter [Planctomycetota bacterium]|jgi:POT family proton-dependent oligopeptide transporter
MGKREYLTAPVASEKMPRVVPYILTNEAFERFSFYGMRCILVVFMTKYLLDAGGELSVMSEVVAKKYHHFFVAAVYFTPFIGALLCDILLGKFKTIILFGLINCLGLLVLVLDQTRVGLAWGLVMIAIGSGAIKPCVSANVGDQFGKSNGHLIAKVYHWFYFSINLGSTFSTLLVPDLLDKYGPRIAFGTPCAAMILATLVYWLGRRKFVHIRPGGIGFVKECFSGEGLKALGKLCIIYVFLIPFWAIFDQMDSSWILQAGKMNRHWLGHEWLPAQVVTLNPFFIMVLIPTFAYVIYPLINKVFRLTALRKVSIGLFLTCVVFMTTALVQRQIDQGFMPSIGWQVLYHLFLAMSEVMVSITCLEFSYTQAPEKMKSFIMAVFFLPIMLGNIFTAVVNWLIENVEAMQGLTGENYYWFFVKVMLVTAVLFIFVAMFYKEKTYIQDET